MALSAACNSLSDGGGEDVESIEQKTTLSWSNLIYYFDYKGADLDAAANTQKTNGFRPISISAYGTTTAPRFAAVFVQKSGADWKFKRGIGTGTFQTEFDDEAKANYKPALLSFDGDASNPVWSAVFVATTTGIPWTRHILVSGKATGRKITDDTTVEYWLKKAREEKLIPSTLSIYGSATDPRYAIVLEPNSGNVEWTVGVIDTGALPKGTKVVGGVPRPPVTAVDGINDTVDEYQARWNAQVPAGNRPSLLDLDDSNHYIAMFRDDSLGPLVGRHNLTAQGLRDAITDQGNNGRYPILISGGGAGTNAHFAALFAQRDTPATRAFTIKGSSATTDTNIDAVDTAMRDFMKRNNVHQAALAAVQDRKLAYARGYTWAEPGYKTTAATTRFRLASVSKVITAMEIMNVMRLSGGKIGGATTLQSLLNLTQPDGVTAPADSRFSKITLGELLSHRYNSLDVATPTGTKQYCLIRNSSTDDTVTGKLPVLQMQSVQKAMSESSLFYELAPGDGCYSNFAYVLLSMVVDQQRTNYMNGVQTDIFNPLNITRFRIANADINTQASDEALYRSFGLHTSKTIFLPTPILQSTPYAEHDFPVTIGAGGWSMAATDVARLLAMLNLRYNNNPVFGTMATPIIDAMTGVAGGPLLGFDVWPGGPFVKGGELDGLQSTVFYTQNGLSYALMWARSEVANSGLPEDDWWPQWGTLQSALTGASLGTRPDLFPTYGMPSLPADPKCTSPKTSCGVNQADSSLKCADLSSDTSNCGSCGKSCLLGQICQSGTCMQDPACSAGKVSCTYSDGFKLCTNLLDDRANCGSCFNKCFSADACVGGFCTSAKSCPGMDTLLCKQPDGTEICANADTDPKNCGGCGITCASGQTCVSKKCTGGTVAAPSNLQATIASGNTVTLTWTDNSTNETGFRIERKVGTGSFTALVTKGANVTSHVDSSLGANTYSYRVIATGSADSAPSNTVVAVLRIPGSDAHVRNGLATSNFGANPTLEVKNAIAAGTTRQAFLRFSLTDVATTVSSAKLRIYGNSVTSAKTVAVSGVADLSWVEGTGTIAAPTTTGITWNTKPAIGSQLASQSVGLTAGWFELDVTSYVQTQKSAGASNVSFAITNVTASDDGPTVFNSRENGSNKPMLVISSR